MHDVPIWIFNKTLKTLHELAKTSRRLKFQFLRLICFLVNSYLYLRC